MDIGPIFGPLSFFSGISLLIWIKHKAKMERMRVERQLMQPFWPQPVAPQDPSVLAELRALKQQINEMQSTCHQFDISFDAALSRLESRIERLETRQAATAVTVDSSPQQVALR